MRKKDKPLSLYSLSKYPLLEITMESQYMSAGAHQAKLLEKFERNKNYVRNQVIALKLVSAMLMIFFPFLSFIFYFELLGEINAYALSNEGAIIIFGSFITTFYIILILYIVLFGLFTTSSLMTGNAFKWLQTLPLSKDKIGKLGYMSLFRSQGVMIILMIFSFPIALLIMTQNIVTFLMSLISSFLITMFSVSILIIVGEKFSRLFSEGGTKSKKRNIFRIISLLSYFFIAFSTGLVLNIGFNAIFDLIISLSISPPTEIIAIILSIIPFPLAPGFLVGITMIPGQVPIVIWFSTLIGIAIFAFITFIMYYIAVRSLKVVSTTEFEYRKAKKPKELERAMVEIDLSIISPVKAYIKKDIIASTKDYQSLIFILMPIVFPLVMLFSMQIPISREVSSPVSIMILWSIIIGANIFIPIILVGGLLSIEESGSSILASLPLVPRDQMKAKILLMLTIHSLSMILMSIILTIQTQSIIVLGLMLSSLPIIWTFLLLMFEMKVSLFGKMKYRYVLEEVNTRHKIMKWIAMIAAELGVYFIILIANSIMFTLFGIIAAISSAFLIGLFSLSLLIFGLYKMFPKAEQMPSYETGGFLRKQPIIGAVVVLLLFISFPLLASFLELFLLIPWMLSLPYLAIMTIEFLWIQTFLALLLLVVVPKGLKLLGKSKSFRDYSKEIGISKVKPVGRILIVGVVTFIIYGVIKFIGANLLGNFVFAPELLFGEPNPLIPGFFSYGWFIWIFMLQPGIWEEFAFRGVMIPMLLKKYSKMTAIVTSSILFGAAHAYNIFYTALIGGDLITVLFQVIYAFFLGLLMGYIFIKTKSLIPTIILHYLINTIGLIIILTQAENIIMLGLYTIVFIGILPAIIGILLLRIVSKNWNSKNSIIEIELEKNKIM